VTSRSLILILATVLLPGVALAIVGVVLVRQQQELLELRAQDQTLLMAREVADSLDANLSRIAARTVSEIEPDSHERYPAGNAVLFVGRVNDGRWVAPFDPAPQSTLADRDFQDQITRFRRVEIEGRPEADLASDYRKAALATENGDRRAFLFIQETRIHGRATEELRNVARSGTDYFDEFGIPLSLYAIEQLGLESADFQSDNWLNYESISYANDLSLASFADGEHDLLRDVERTFSGISSWEISLDQKWIVGKFDDAILAVRVDSLSSLVGGRPIRTNPGEGTASLAPVFPGLFVVMTQTSEENLPLTLWIVALVLVLVVTSLGSYLLFRDVRRERRLSELRARFVSSVSHEVRTPLAAIRLYTDSLLAYGPGEDDEWKQDLETISYETNRLTRMLDNVLRASSIEKGTERYQQTPGDLSAPVKRAISAMMPALADAECSVDVDIGRVPATFDSDAIEQAVVNLLSNASKYAPGSNVHVTCHQSDNQAIIKVSDTGPGLPADSTEKIFEPYYRGDHKATGSRTGTGLGLSLVRHIVRGHGGEVNVESVAGKGSTFSIHLPLDA